MKKVLVIFNSGSVSGPEKSVLPALAYYKNKFKASIDLVFLEETRLEKTSREAARLYAESLGLNSNPIQVHSRFDMKAIKQLNQLISDGNYQVVHGQDVKASFYTYLASRRLKIKKVTTFHGFSRRGIINRFYEKLYFKILRFFDEVILISKSDYEVITKRGYQRTRILLNAIKEPIFFNLNDSIKILQQYTPVLPERPWAILPARLSLEKNHEYLFHALSLLPDEVPFTVWIFGKGDQEEILKKLALDLNIQKRVIFAGYQENVERLMKCFDFFLLVSTSEGLSISLLEAIHAELFILASNIESITNVIEDQSCALFSDLENPEALTKNIIKAIQLSKVEKAQLTKKLKLKIENDYSLDHWSKQMMEIYQ